VVALDPSPVIRGDGILLNLSASRAAIAVLFEKRPAVYNGSAHFLAGYLFDDRQGQHLVPFR
jgi:hypothetical protein